VSAAGQLSSIKIRRLTGDVLVLPVAIQHARLDDSINKRVPLRDREHELSVDRIQPIVLANVPIGPAREDPAHVRRRSDGVNRRALRRRHGRQDVVRLGDERFGTDARPQRERQPAAGGDGGGI
jgi:hypothetical protein